MGFHLPVYFGNQHRIALLTVALTYGFTAEFRADIDEGVMLVGPKMRNIRKGYALTISSRMPNQVSNPPSELYSTTLYKLQDEGSKGIPIDREAVFNAAEYKWCDEEGIPEEIALQRELHILLRVRPRSLTDLSKIALIPLVPMMINDIELAKQPKDYLRDTR